MYQATTRGPKSTVYAKGSVIDGMLLTIMPTTVSRMAATSTATMMASLCHSPVRAVLEDHSPAFMPAAEPVM